MKLNTKGGVIGVGLAIAIALGVAIAGYFAYDYYQQSKMEEYQPQDNGGYRIEGNIDFNAGGSTSGSGTGSGSIDTGSGSTGGSGSGGYSY